MMEILPENMYEVELLKEAKATVKRGMTEKEALNLVMKIEAAAFSGIPRRRETISRFERPFGSSKITHRQANAALDELERALMGMRNEIIRKYPSITKKLY
jgi:hypothetical protein